MPINVVQLLSPFARRAEEISDRWNEAVDDETHPAEAMLLCAVVEAIAALERLRMRPAVFFARLSIEGTILFDASRDVPIAAKPVKPLLQVTYEPEVRSYMEGGHSDLSPGIGHNGGPPWTSWGLDA